MAKRNQNPQDLAVDLGLLYKIEYPAAVSQFVSAHPFLLNLLLEAFPKLETHFGSGSPVILRVIDEPDSVNESELFAMVQTSLPAEEALRRLESFDNDWWVEASARAKCKLNFSVEFR